MNIYLLFLLVKLEIITVTMDSELKQKQLYFIHDQLKDLHSKLDHEVQSTIPLENLMTIGNLNCLLLLIILILILIIFPS